MLNLPDARKNSTWRRSSCSLAQPTDRGSILTTTPLMRGSRAALRRHSHSAGRLWVGLKRPCGCSAMPPDSDRVRMEPDLKRRLHEQQREGVVGGQVAE